MKKLSLNTESAPAAIGPYSQAVAAGGFLYISGQIALNIPGVPMEEADLRQQVEQVMKNLEAILKRAEIDFSHVVKSTIFLAPGEDFATVNEVYGRCFPSHPPARETVWVHSLPANARVEISMIAIL
ncbi:MAG: Rid family detoxifying hydrolase [Bacteroidota bacterium]